MSFRQKEKKRKTRTDRTEMGEGVSRAEAGAGDFHRFRVAGFRYREYVNKSTGNL